MIPLYVRISMGLGDLWGYIGLGFAAGVLLTLLGMAAYRTRR